MIGWTRKRSMIPGEVRLHICLLSPGQWPPPGDLSAPHQPVMPTFGDTENDHCSPAPRPLQLMCLDRASSVTTDVSFAALVPAPDRVSMMPLSPAAGPARHARQIRIMEINFNIRRRHALTRGLTWRGNYYSLTLIMLLLNFNQGPAASLQ